MSVTYIPGLWGEVGEQFNKFAEKLPDIIHPNRKYLWEVQRALAADPTLMQKFADAEAQSPGYLERIGLKQLIPLAQKAGPSAELVAENKKKAVLQKPLTPEQQEEYEAKVLGTQTSAQRLAAQLERDYKAAATAQIKLETAIAEATKDGRIAEAESGLMTLKQRKAAQAVVERLAKENKNPFQAFREGSLTTEEMAAVQAVPEYAKSWDAAFEYWRTQEEIKNRKERNAIDWAQIAANGPEEQLNKQRANVAAAIATYTGLPIDDIYRYMSLSAQDRLRLEAADPNSLTDQDKILLRSAAGVKSFQLKQGRNEVRLQLNGNRTQLSLFTEKILSDKTNKDTKIQAINGYNQMMETIFRPLVEAGIEKEVPQVWYDPSKWRGNVKDLVWTGNNPESQQLAESMGLKLPARQQEFNRKLEQTKDLVNYDVLADMIRGTPNPEASLKQVVADMQKDGVAVDTTKLRMAVTKKGREATKRR